MLRELGIEPSKRHSKHLDTVVTMEFSQVITLCDKVCPEFPGHPGRVLWSIPDPARPGDDRETMAALRQVAAELDTRIGYLLAGLGAQPGWSGS